MRGILSVGHKDEVSRKKKNLPNGEKKTLKSLPNTHSKTLLVLRVAVFITRVVTLSVLPVLRAVRAIVAHRKNRHNINAIVLIVECLGPSGKSSRYLGLVCRQRPPATSCYTESGGRGRR